MPILFKEKNSHFKILEEQLTEYFEGKRKEFFVPLHFVGSDSRNLFRSLDENSYGETWSYAQTI